MTDTEDMRHVMLVNIYMELYGVSYDEAEGYLLDDSEDEDTYEA